VTTWSRSFRLTGQDEVGLRQSTNSHECAKKDHYDKIAGLQDPLDLWESNLEILIAEWQMLGHVYIGGNFNSDLDDESSHITKFMERNTLEDLLRQKYTELPSSTFARVKKRIDGWMATQDAPCESGGYCWKGKPRNSVFYLSCVGCLV